jgi:hypothetical protein
MTKITEDQRAELLASNASRDVVEAVLARVAALESAVTIAMAPRYSEDEVEVCPWCSGGYAAHFGHGNDGAGYQHRADCEFVALGLGVEEWAPVHGPFHVWHEARVTTIHGRDAACVRRRHTRL